MHATLKKQLNNDLMQQRVQEQLVGEIVDKRFVLMEARGRVRNGLKFEAYDMEALTRIEITVMVNAEGGVKGYLLMDPNKPPPIPPLPVPKPRQELKSPPLVPTPSPPIPTPQPVVRAAPPPPPPPPAQDLEAQRLEAAWFARGEQIDQQGYEDPSEEDWDFSERQANLEEVAKELTPDAILRYALSPA
jgi:hypothetical protein